MQFPSPVQRLKCSLTTSHHQVEQARRKITSLDNLLVRLQLHPVARSLLSTPPQQHNKYSSNETIKKNRNSRAASIRPKETEPMALAFQPFQRRDKTGRPIHCSSGVTAPFKESKYEKNSRTVAAKERNAMITLTGARREPPFGDSSGGYGTTRDMFFAILI
ncbi:shikimate dehydrogenase [Striga asiatica]|uniref:Shikimate dehydrogenase n=1 Tax=Striga asiatica TaxID=4170 RepID=A0A5A7Q0F7_STRAF|nr:shikimate dehydrogenase [Striga asiatica]